MMMSNNNNMTTTFFLTVLAYFASTTTTTTTTTAAAATAELLNGVCDESFCVCATDNDNGTMCPEWMYEAYGSNVTLSVLGNRTLLCSYVGSYAPNGLEEVVAGNEVTQDGDTYYYEVEVTMTNGVNGPVILNYTATDPAPECAENAPFPLLTSASPTTSPFPPSFNGCNDPDGVCSSSPYHQGHFMGILSVGAMMMMMMI
jgi:hypothetical protein